MHTPQTHKWQAPQVLHQVFNEASQDSPGAETKIWHRVRIARRKSLWEWTVEREREIISSTPVPAGTPQSHPKVAPQAFPLLCSPHLLSSFSIQVFLRVFFYWAENLLLWQQHRRYYTQHGNNECQHSLFSVAHTHSVLQLLDKSGVFRQPGEQLSLFPCRHHTAVLLVLLENPPKWEPAPQGWSQLKEF